MQQNLLPQEAKAILEKLLHAIQELSLDDYVKPLSLLSNSSVGEHTRHIIELFQCLLEGYDAGIINYDDRKRNKKIETEIDYAIDCIAVIISKINLVNKNLVLESMHNSSNKATIETNFYRELLYNIEHCIHHQAIIKIGLTILNKEHIDAEFGFAKSTIAYKNNVYS